MSVQGILKKVLILLLISIVPPVVDLADSTRGATKIQSPTAWELMQKQRKETCQTVRPQGRQRVIQFPKDKALGALSVPYKGVDKPLYPKAYGTWEYFGQAQGDVVVPADETLQLEIGPKCLENLPLLLTLGPNDIHRLVITAYDRPVPKPDETVMPHLSHLTGLKELEFWQVEPSGKGLKYLKGLKSLKHLVIQSPNLRDADLACLSELKSLETLVLTAQNVTDQGLRHLAALQSLSRLHISADFRGPGLACLGQLPSLTSLTLVSDKLMTNGLVPLKQLPSLVKLEIYYFKRPITDAELTDISEIPHLEELSVRGRPMVSDSVVAHLRSMASLRAFDIDGFEVTDARLQQLKKLKSLDSLKCLFISDEGFAYLAELPKLKCIHCSPRLDVTDKGLLKLAELRSLEELHITGDAVTDKTMSHIANLPNIRELMIDGNITNDGLARLTKLESLTGLVIGPNCKGISVAGLNRLNEIPTLASLEVHHPSQDNAVLDISRLTHLENLQLNGVIIGDEDLASLAKLKRLKRLIIICWKGKKKITDSGLRHLAGLTSLKWLSISCPQAGDMTDDGLAYLANLKGLNILGVGEGNFTDKGLARLERLKGLTDSGVTAENAFSNAAVQRLQSELPNLRSSKVMP